MKKIVFVDGSQGVGKSTLIQCISNYTPVYVYKFPFVEYSKVFSLNEGGSLKGFQLGKDLATLYFLKSMGVKPPWAQIVDRGPMSTVYYSLTTGRMTVEEVEEFFKILKESTDLFSFVFVIGKNSPELLRDRGDGFDELKSKEVGQAKALRLMVELAKKYNINLKIFENDFSLGIKKNSQLFYQLVKEEL